MLRRILHVDDDEDIRAVAKVALEVVGGFIVLQCGSGPEALRQAEQFAPDLVLLDVMMPGMDGEETYKALREIDALRATPIVFVTAKVHEEAVESLNRLGAAGIVAKPFDPMGLAGLLHSFWQRTRCEMS